MAASNSPGSPPTRSSIPPVRVQAAAWAGALILWVAVTRGRHPTFPVGVLATASLLACCACAVYANHLVLVPRLLRRRRFAAYAIGLTMTAATTALAGVGLVDVVYFLLWHPDPRRYGFLQNLALDLAATVLHLFAAGVVVMALGRRSRSAPSSAPLPDEVARR